MTDDIPNPNGIDAVVEQINERTDWNVKDWDYTVGYYETPELTVTLEWQTLNAGVIEQRSSDYFENEWQDRKNRRLFG